MTRRGVPLLTALVLALLVTGCTTAGTKIAATKTTSTSRASGAGDAAGSFRSARGVKPGSPPARVLIPSIAVDSPLDRLGRAKDGTVQVPSRWEVAGWYALGPKPGELGSAVILGHVDSTRGPAVFYRVRELRRGSPIVVERSDGSRLTFLVDRVETFGKNRFPTDDVYYPTLTPTLRLVTCGGEFDFRAGHYLSNVIAFATLRQ